MNWHRGWAPYVPVAQRKAQGLRAAQKQLKKGQTLSPIRIATRAMASTFWGKAWCDYIEKYSDYANRLPRGRTYARNGSIIDLQITAGKVTALVCGSELYKINIDITRMQPAAWKNIVSSCANSVHSLIDLMCGKLSDSVVKQLTDPAKGMFPKSKEMRMSCSCPDSAGLCKHLAAVLYGVGNRLDSSPELLFLLRDVDQSDLVAASMDDGRLSATVSASSAADAASGIANDELGSIFGIDILPSANAPQKGTQKATGSSSRPKGRSVRAKGESTAVNASANSPAITSKISKANTSKTSRPRSAVRNSSKRPTGSVGSK